MVLVYFWGVSFSLSRIRERRGCGRIFILIMLFWWCLHWKKVLMLYNARIENNSASASIDENSKYEW